MSVEAVAVPHSRWRSYLHTWRFSNASALYVWIVIVIFFSIWKPALFPHYATFTQIVNQNAVTALLALALVFPLATGVFDLSIAYSFGLANVVCAKLLGTTGIPIAGIIAITLAVSMLVGLCNAIVVVTFKIDSFIGTLATGSIIYAVILLVSGNQQLVAGVTRDNFPQIAFANWHQISAPVFYALGLAVLLWYFLDHTAYGRFSYASGLGPDAARLAGIRVERYRFVALISSATVGGFAGIVVTAIINAGSPTVGPPYLIPAFASCFLGATQLKGGLFNAWGTLMAVFLLGTVDAGLALASVPEWTPYIFTGSVLIIALAISGQQRRGWRRRTPEDEIDHTAPDPAHLAPEPTHPTADTLATTPPSPRP